jgi:hypothetical protein
MSFVRPAFTVFALLVFSLCGAMPAVAAPAPAKLEYRIDYTIELMPKTDLARVTIHVDNGRIASRFNFKLQPSRQGDVKADGNLQLEGDRAIWSPPAAGGSFSLTAKISHQRKSGAYDARMTRDYAIFRGDDLVPSARVRSLRGATSRARLRFKLPPGWTHVDTGWPREQGDSFIIDNPKRRFDRPVGWMIAGRIGTRVDHLAASSIAVAAPVGSALQRMDVLAFLNVIWPEAEHAFGKMPRKLLIVGDGDPMWRGGLSSPNSMFLHADRPLISENATSALLHEMTHVATRIRGQRNDDWIAEGLAEFYSIELLRRSGAVTQTRYDRSRAWLKKWSADVRTLRVKTSKGKTTARAVLLFQELDREIRQRSKDKRDIDDVTRALMRIGKVSLADLRKASEKAAGGPVKTLDSPLLK